jgi:hypothetical protein
LSWKVRRARRGTRSSSRSRTSSSKKKRASARRALSTHSLPFAMKPFRSSELSMTAMKYGRSPEGPRTGRNFWCVRIAVTVTSSGSSRNSGE